MKRKRETKNDHSNAGDWTVTLKRHPDPRQTRSLTGSRQKLWYTFSHFSPSTTSFKLPKLAMQWITMQGKSFWKDSHWNSHSSNVIWKKFCLQRNWRPRDEEIMEFSNKSWKNWFRGHLPFHCYHCGSSSTTVSWFGFYNIFLCRNCQGSNDKCATITGAEAMKYHNLKESELNQMRYITRATLQPSTKLFLVSDITDYIKRTRLRSLSPWGKEYCWLLFKCTVVTQNQYTQSVLT